VGERVDTQVTGDEGQEQRGADTRRRILGVALELFGTEGYAGTSIRDITERMGLTKASLYYHFRSKEEILDAITRPIKQELEALLAEATADPKPAPAELLTKVVDLLSRRVRLISIVMGDPSAHGKPGRGGAEGHAGSRPGLFQMIRLGNALAADDTVEARTRAFCALGAAQVGAFLASSAVLAEVGPLHGSSGGEDAEADTDPSLLDRILSGSEHLLSVEQRAAIVDAALRALDG